MNRHLIAKAADWFDDADNWNAFVELCENRQSIEEEWYVRASHQLRNYFVANPSLKWDFVAWENDRDTWWYLTDFGVNSVGIGFGWRYWWCFGARGTLINREVLREKLAEPKYGALSEAFGSVHDHHTWAGELVQHRGFTIGSPSDGNVSESELAWYAGHRTAGFIQQAVAKVEAFTRNAKVTDLMVQLNEELLSESDSS